MKKHQRKIEAGISNHGGYGHYNFLVTYPSKKEANFASTDATLYDLIKGSDTGIFSTNSGVWRQVKRLSKHHF